MNTLIFPSIQRAFFQKPNGRWQEIDRQVIYTHEFDTGALLLHLYDQLPHNQADQRHWIRYDAGDAIDAQVELSLRCQKTGGILQDLSTFITTKRVPLTVMMGDLADALLSQPEGA